LRKALYTLLLQYSLPPGGAAFEVSNLNQKERGEPLTFQSKVARPF